MLRQQFHKDVGSGTFKLINLSTGQEQRTDEHGSSLRAFKSGISGVALPFERRTKSIELNNPSIRVTVPQTLKQTNMVTEMLTENSPQYLPRQRTIDILKERFKGEYLNSHAARLRIRGSPQSSISGSPSVFKRKTTQDKKSNSPKQQHPSTDKPEKSHLLFPQTLPTIQGGLAHGISASSLGDYNAATGRPRNLMMLRDASSQQLLSQSLSKQSLSTIGERSSFAPPLQPYNKLEGSKDFRGFRKQTKSLVNLDRYSCVKKEHLADNHVQPYLARAKNDNYVENQTKSLKLLPPCTEDKFYQPIRRSPSQLSLRQLTMCRDADVVSNVYLNDCTTKQDILSRTIDQVTDYQYPLQGSKKLENAPGINRLPIKLSMRTLDDFDPPSKLQVKVNTVSKSQYEVYTQCLAQERRAVTKNRFQLEMQKVCRFPSQLQLKSLMALKSANPEFQAYAQWKKNLEDRKMHAIHQMQLIRDKEIMRQLEVQKQKTKKQFEHQLRSSWARDATSMDFSPRS